MRRYALLMLAMMVLFLLMFGVVEWLQIAPLTDPGPWMAHQSWQAALVGQVILLVDVLLPAPASLVMIANGALFGIYLGSLLSLVGGTAASTFGFWLGRRGGSLLNRLVSEEEQEQANRLLEQFGDLAIVVTRPIPILAETVAIIAGTSTVSWSRMLVASMAGCLPAAVIYAVTGATTTHLDSLPLVFALVLLIAGLFWIIGRRIRATHKTPETVAS